MPGTGTERATAWSLEATRNPRLGSMKRQRIIVSTLALLACLSAFVPAAALAGAPLLGGYGGPGAGAQTILGAALINGAGSGSSSGGGASGASRASAPATSTPATDAAGASTRAGSAAPGASGDGTHGAAGAAHATHPRAAGANPHLSHLDSATAVTTSAATTPWFSGADLLALLL